MKHPLFTFLFLLLCAFDAYGQLVLNELNPSRGLEDERGKNVDWVEIFNASSDSINLGTYYLSDNPNNLDKWAFPAVVLPPNGMLTVLASGQEDATFIHHWESLVRADNTWRYWNGSAPPAGYANWRALGYDDASWPSGPGGIGYGDNDDGTIIGATASVLLRHEFAVHDVEEIAELVFHADYDDAFIAYLNGEEIMRSGNLSASPAYHELAASAHEAVLYQGGVPDAVVFEGHAVQELPLDGANVLAVRVHNATANSSDLSGNFFLSAAMLTSEQRYQSLPAWFAPEAGRPHVSFKLAAGETLVLSDSSETVLDSVRIPEGVTASLSYGRQTDGGEHWCFFDTPSPNASNNQSTCYSGITAAPVVDLPSGWHASTNPVNVTTAPNATSHYTTNGDEPDRSDPVVNGTLYVASTGVLSVKSFSNDGLSLPSVTVDRTYILDEDNHGLPVVSILTDEDHLWDWDSGIYVMGPNASADYPYFGANFWQPWSRKSRMEYFDGERMKQFDAVFDLEIHGGWSRGEPQKSFRVDAKSIYTGDIEYALIERKPDVVSYNNFNLRNGGQHGIFNRIQDAVMSRLAAGTHIDRMGYQACIVYVNGVYWGLYGIREKFDEHYVESNHGVNSDDVQLLNQNGALAGDDAHFAESYEMITGMNAWSPEFVEVFSSRFDLDNYLDYFAFEIYIQNRDWMGIDWGINNVKLWREDTAGATWRYMMYDTDFAFGLYGGDIYQNYINRARQPNFPNVHSQIFDHALKNPDFRCRFVNRSNDLINTTFQTANFNAAVDELRAELAPAIPDHIAAWSAQMGPPSYTFWLNSVNGLKAYNSGRIATARQHLNQSFSLQGPREVSLAASPAQTGHVRLNSLLPELPWEGIYHGGCDISAEAIPRFGYRFSHWTSNDSNYDQAQEARLQVALNVNTSLTAHFRPCEEVVQVDVVEDGHALRPLLSESVSVASYQWLLNGTVVSNDSALYNPAGGTYELVVRFDSCEIRSNAYTVSREHYEILLFPNPTTDEVRVQFVLDQEAPLTLSIFTAQGQRVWQETFTAFLGQYNGRVDVSHLPHGTYVLRATTPSVSYSGRLVKLD